MKLIFKMNNFLSNKRLSWRYVLYTQYECVLSIDYSETLYVKKTDKASIRLVCLI